MTAIARPVNAAANVATRNSAVGPFHKSQSDKKNLFKFVSGRNLNRCKTNSGFCRYNKTNDIFPKMFCYTIGFSVSN